MDTALAWIARAWSYPWVRALVYLAGSLAAWAVLRLFALRVLTALVARTRTRVDDIALDHLRRPIFVSVLAIGITAAARTLTLGGTLAFVIRGVVETVVIAVWALAAVRLGGAVLKEISRRGPATGIVQARTLPALDMLLKVVVISGAIYAAFLVWHIDVTGWLASAGIIGIAVGFAAKDTLANLFAGIFILADAPYKLGDFVEIDGGLKGRVTDIGVRSTRILTRDDIEVIVPNAIMGQSRIVNHTGGPWRKARVRAPFSVAYGSDLGRVRDAVMPLAAGIPLVASEPGPVLRFRAFGDSGLDFEYLVWTEDPERWYEVVDTLNERIYRALGAAGIEIPYPKRDLYIKELPEGRPRAGLMPPA